MYIKVSVITEGKRESFKRVSKDHVDIVVREKAERNMANRRIIEMVKDFFKVRRVRIISGYHSPSKIIDVER